MCLLSANSYTFMFFRIRDIGHPQEPGKDGKTLEKRMCDLIKRTADDVTNSAHICDYYHK